ncbi:Beta-galactosidase [Limihaloglobus sulfuriphilus]|uniref:beta-galactosidase n=1 Tax=Limihaloglobus sulfuriphilus TaxID=1851148 RepID=A0A1Q2MCP3_9BACT|nr:sugar-binding domain-containing protein [Limihaloglobus sulfuriphilus]AQQ70440.1 Beta-galactosidase [Limihaloglobus sulfuriphilus]
MKLPYLFAALTVSLITIYASAGEGGKYGEKENTNFSVFKDDFSHNSIETGTWLTNGRGKFDIYDGILKIAGGWVTAGEQNWSNYSVKFRARAPKDARQVQIWAGLRNYNRDFRYVAALRGGNNNHLYLARYGAEGYDKLLAIEPLEFSPSPGKWYIIEVAAAGDKIAVYLNEEDKPRIVVSDEESPFISGKASLGGSYITTEFDWIKIEPLAPDALDGLRKTESPAENSSTKEAERISRRAGYKPFYLQEIPENRVELKLDGKWLFIPDYEAGGEPFTTDYDDSTAHVMDVPNFWVPLQCWLEGEFTNGFNKGQNDKFHRMETARCEAYTFDYKKTRSAWYRHYIDLPKNAIEKKVVIEFNGIAVASSIYFNGNKIHDNIGMYMPMKLDVTDHVTAGRNVLAVHVWRNWDDESSALVDVESIDDNYADAWNVIAEAQQGRLKKLSSGQRAQKLLDKHIQRGFYRGDPGGIWRTAKIVISSKLKIEDCYFVPSMNDAQIQVEYSNSGNKAQDVQLTYEINDAVTDEVLCGGSVEKVKLAGKSARTADFNTPKVSPKLWAPGKPNLYNITFRLIQNDEIVDSLTEKVGFRTIELRDEQLYFNRRPLWVRGANHMPGHIRPYDKDLADRFMQLALDHNVIATRTHCSPWSEKWLDSADQAGVMISFEGAWPWLMLRDIPSEEAIEIWKREFTALVKANRNRPSIFLWTMNNEMKFYLLGDSDEVITEKGSILTDGINALRSVDSSRPVVADSAYYRKHLVRSGRYERIIKANNFDEGDIDDPHGYFNWYNKGTFHFFNGEFGRDYCTPGRPALGQEISTGYPRSDDGLATRFYLFEHQTPQTTVGKKAYEHCDPDYFIGRHSMMTKELAEMFRRVEHENTSGVMLFAFETWFYNTHLSERVSPMLTARRLKTAYQPLLASAELWGRHFYAGDNIDTDITLVNDSLEFAVLKSPLVICRILYGSEVLAEKTVSYDDLEYYQTAKQKVSIKLPSKLPELRVDCRLTLTVISQDVLISENEYDITAAQKDWAMGSGANTSLTYYMLEGDANARRLLDFYGLNAVDVQSPKELVGRKSVLIIGGFENMPLSYEKTADFVASGGNAILLNNGPAVVRLFPDKVLAYKNYRHEIVTMNYDESKVFDGIEPLDIAWFSDGRNVPYTAGGRYTIDRFSNDIKALAETLEWHGYLNSPLDYKKIGGCPLFTLRHGKGRVIAAQIRTDAIEFDPVASRLILNILKYDFKENQ